MMIYDDQKGYNLFAKSYHKLYNSVQKWFSIHIILLQIVRNLTSKTNFNGSSTLEKVIRKEYEIIMHVFWKKSWQKSHSIRAV